MGGRGGARPGAGRPRKAEKYGGQVAAAEDRIADRLPGLVDSLLALATGVLAGRDIGGGKALVYTTPPDRQAAVYLLDRIMGRPGESLRVEGDGSTHRTPEEDARRFDDILATLRQRPTVRGGDEDPGQHGLAG